MSPTREPNHHFLEEAEGERTAYVVLNTKELMQRVVAFRPAGINA